MSTETYKRTHLTVCYRVTCRHIFCLVSPQYSSVDRQMTDIVCVVKQANAPRKKTSIVIRGVISSRCLHYCNKRLNFIGQTHNILLCQYNNTTIKTNRYIYIDGVVHENVPHVVLHNLTLEFLRVSS